LTHRVILGSIAGLCGAVTIAIKHDLCRD